jgi:hypothetical protein
MNSINVQYPMLTPNESGAEQKVQQRVILKNDMYHIKLPFPWKLHQLLEDVETESNQHIVAWIPNGKAFKVHKPTEFCEKIMKTYFRQTQFKSFTRQVRLNQVTTSQVAMPMLIFSPPNYSIQMTALHIRIFKNRRWT